MWVVGVLEPKPICNQRALRNQMILVEESKDGGNERNEPNVTSKYSEPATPCLLGHHHHHVHYLYQLLMYLGTISHLFQLLIRFKFPSPNEERHQPRSVKDMDEKAIRGAAD